jgi:hypothetical protein
MTQQHRSTWRCGCDSERINQRSTVQYDVGNIDVANAMYGRAVLPHSELVHGTHPLTRES